jgi:hypothetical protein
MDNKLTNTIINYLREEYKDLTPITSKNYPNTLFYIQNNKVIFDYNKKYKCSFINDDIFSFIYQFFGLIKEEVHQIIREWINVMINISPGLIVEDSLIAQIRWSDVEL